MDFILYSPLISTPIASTDGTEIRAKTHNLHSFSYFPCHLLPLFDWRTGSAPSTKYLLLGIIKRNSAKGKYIDGKIRELQQIKRAIVLLLLLLINRSPAQIQRRATRRRIPGTVRTRIDGKRSVVLMFSLAFIAAQIVYLHD